MTINGLIIIIILLVLNIFMYIHELTKLQEEYLNYKKESLENLDWLKDNYETLVDKYRIENSVLKQENEKYKELLKEGDEIG